MFIPVPGHVIVLGPLAATPFSGVQGAAAVGGFSALGGTLMSIGIPKDSVLILRATSCAERSSDGRARISGDVVPSIDRYVGAMERVCRY
jgi:hypothetical protein